MSVGKARFDETRLGATDGRLRDALQAEADRINLADAKRRLASRTAIRPTDAREAGIISVDARVEVRMTEDPNFQPPIPYLEVAVYALMNPGHYKRVLLPPGASERDVSIAAGAACEGLVELGNPFEPSQAARSAVDKLRELRR